MAKSHKPSSSSKRKPSLSSTHRHKKKSRHASPSTSPSLQSSSPTPPPSRHSKPRLEEPKSAIESSKKHSKHKGHHHKSSSSSSRHRVSSSPDPISGGRRSSSSSRGKEKRRHSESKSPHGRHKREIEMARDANVTGSGGLSISKFKPITPTATSRTSSGVSKPRHRDHQKKKKHKSHQKVKSDPRYLLLCESLQNATTHLRTLLPAQLEEAQAMIFEELANANTSPTTGESYDSLISNLRNSLLPNKGTVVPFASIKKFQRDCVKWGTELNALLKEYDAEQRALIELGKELGIGADNELDRNEKDDQEFQALISKIQKTGKTWIHKMEKMEKQILQVESQENRMMMQAM